MSNADDNLLKKADKSKKDLWDVIAVVGTVSSLISTITLGILTYSFNKKSDEVKNSLASFQNSVAKAQLVHTLIQDLRTNDTPQDLALIGLNRSIGDVTDDPTGSDRLLVVQIANTVFQARKDAALKKPGGNQDPTAQIALQIITERCAEKSPILKQYCATAVVKSVQDTGNKLTTNRAAIISKSNARPGESSTLKPVSDHYKLVAGYLASASVAIVYIQYNTTEESAVAAALRTALNESGSTTAPEVDHVPGAYENSVRYFHSQDQDAAKRLVEFANKFFENAGKPNRFPPPRDYSPRNDVPPGQLELWIQ